MDKKDKLIAELSSRIILLSCIILVLLFALVYAVSKISMTANVDKVEYDGLCGNAFQQEVHSEKFEQSYHGEYSYEKAEKLFKQNCIVCHSTGRNTLTGPGLEGAMNRVPSKKWLALYILNRDSLLKAEDPYSMKLHAMFPETEMTNFKGSLTDKDVSAIIAYLEASTTNSTAMP